MGYLCLTEKDKLRPLIWGLPSVMASGPSKPIILLASSSPISLWAISRPRKTIMILTRSPSPRNSLILRILILRSFSPIFKPSRICLSSLLLDFFLARLSSFIFWYWYLPQSMTLTTGGVALAEISTRSTPASRAMSCASRLDMTPSCSPLVPITRTSG